MHDALVRIGGVGFVEPSRVVLPFARIGRHVSGVARSPTIMSDRWRGVSAFARAPRGGSGLPSGEGFQ
jgi:hypothetical protein